MYIVVRTHKIVCFQLRHKTKTKQNKIKKYIKNIKFTRKYLKTKEKI